MNYWAETLQDDCYLISRDGWKAELLPPAKKNATWENYVCELLPVEIVARVKFGEELTSINLLKTHLEEVVQNIAEIDEKLADEELEEEIDEEGLKTTRKALEYSVKQFKKAIKDETEKLTAKIVNYYAGLDEKAIKRHVIGDKWMATLESRFAAELVRVKAKIVADVKSLAARYAVTLPDAERAVDELSAKVARHLAAMGIEV
jgi:type I restriction enzyme M protein